MKRKRKILRLLGMFLNGCWQSDENNSNVTGGAQDVIYGDEAEPSKYPFVLLWGASSTVKGEENEFSSTCTCGLIGPKTCLTAAHCVITGQKVGVNNQEKNGAASLPSADVKYLTANEELKAFRTSTFSFSNAQDTAVHDNVGQPMSWKTKVTRVSFHPAFLEKYVSKEGTISSDLVGYSSTLLPDVAVITLHDSPINALPGLTPVSIDVRPVFLPERLAFLGYGCHLENSPALAGDTRGNYDGVLRVGTVEVSSHQNVLLALGWLPQRAQATVSNAKIDYSWSILTKGGAFHDQSTACYGDSGGPLLRPVNEVTFAPNGYAIVGVTASFLSAKDLGVIKPDGQLDVKQEEQANLRPEFIADQKLSLMNRYTSLSDGPEFKTGTWLKSFGSDGVKVFKSKK